MIDSQQWVSVAERLPAFDQSVALVNVNKWENVGGDWLRNIHACGYLARLGSGPYWSVRGERAMSLDAFTHWLALPAPPDDEAEGEQR
jgi:hypothetical protein